MIDVKKNPYVKYPLFGTLYFSQGLIFALATVLISVYLEGKGIDETIIGLIIALAYIPWVIKFVFGWAVDYFYKITRRKFIIFGGVLSAISLIILSVVDPKTNLYLFILLVFLASCGIAFLDVSADAWAIELSTEKERGKINGAMFSGLFLGIAITSIMMSLIADNYSYSLTFVLSGLIILVIIIFPLLIKDVSTRIKKSKLKKLLVKEFKKKNTQLIAVFFPFSAFSFGLLAIVLPLYMKTELTLTQSTIGWVMAVGSIATVIGNIVGGFMADHWGRKNSLFVFLGFSLIFAGSLVFADTIDTLIIIWSIVGFLHGGNYSAFGALAMDITNPQIGASQYSLLMACGNAGEMGGAALSGTMITIIGFGRTFLYSGWIYGPALLVLYYIKRTYKATKKRKK